MRISDWSSDVCSSDLLEYRIYAEREFRPIRRGRRDCHRYLLSDYRAQRRPRRHRRSRRRHLASDVQAMKEEAMKEARLECFAARLRTRAQVVLTSFVALFAVSTATAAVTVDQSPLFVQQSLPPNIGMMFDDSGSMDWAYIYGEEDGEG